RLRRHLLGDLVRVVGRRQAGADVEELPDPGLAGQVAHGPGEEPALQPGDVGDAREHLQDRVADLAVGREVVLAAQQVVPHPGRVRGAGVEPGRERGAPALRGTGSHCARLPFAAPASRTARKAPFMGPSPAYQRPGPGYCSYGRGVSGRWEHRPSAASAASVPGLEILVIRGITPDDFRGRAQSYLLPPDSYRRSTGTGVDQGNGVMEMSA